MDTIDYYYVYLCLCELCKRKKVTRNVANKILKEYEICCQPVFKHKIV